ncbi:hypothetical protein [Vitreimonas flagellata]|uniref:hypothetical protein n=1 Tax=Vitreimonas flagellata TaxID=2560861 RepID=UPI00107516BC|nr:hypothetical protein [Vitreimonas flagellata]
MRLSNLLARAASAALSVALIACADPAEPEPDPAAAAHVGEAQPLPHTLPPPTEETPRYVGLWATTAEGCSNPAWRFEADGISTQGEVSCEFRGVRITEAGYEIAATCYAQAPPEPHNIQISFAESARAMMLTGGPWAPAPSLVYCRGL